MYVEGHMDKCPDSCRQSFVFLLSYGPLDLGFHFAHMKTM